MFKFFGLYDIIEWDLHVFCALPIVPIVFFALLLSGSASYANLGKEGWTQTECMPFYETGGDHCCLKYDHDEKKCVKNGQETEKYMNISLDICNTTIVAQFEDWDCKEKSDVGSWPRHDANPIACWTNCEQWMDENPTPRYGKAKSMTIAAFVIIFLFFCCTCIAPLLAFVVLMFIWSTTVLNCGLHVREFDGCNMIGDAYYFVGVLLPLGFLCLGLLGCCDKGGGPTIFGGFASMAVFCSTFLHWILTFIGIFRLDGIHPKECFDVNWCGAHVYVTMGGPGAWASLACVASYCYMLKDEGDCDHCFIYVKDLFDCCCTVFMGIFCGLKELLCCFFGIILTPCAQLKGVCSECLEEKRIRNEILKLEKADYATKVAIFKDVDKRWQCARDTVMPLIGYRDHIWNEIWTMMWEMEVQAFVEGSDLSDFHVAINLWGPYCPIDGERYDWDTSVQIKTCCNCFKGEFLQIITLAQSKGDIDWICSKNSKIEISEIEINEITTQLPALPGAEV